MNFEEWYRQNENRVFRGDAEIGWEACKEEILKLLQQHWTGLDLSINSCDDYYIEKIKKEI
jgi:hypothetical protein